MRVSFPGIFPRQASRGLTILLSFLMVMLPVGGRAAGGRKPPERTSSSARAKKPDKKTKPGKKVRRSKPVSREERRTRTAQLRQAFVASTELRPMAQQLATLRTPEAYAGVTAYAHRHSGGAAAAAYLALGHAYMLDRRYTEAETSLRQVVREGPDLADYADFLDAQASHAAGDDIAAAALLHGFADHYPDSIFDARAPELEANILLALGNATGAREALVQAADTAAAERPGYQLAEGQVELAMGEKDAAERSFKSLLLSHPLTQEGQTARARLTEMGAGATLTGAELRSLGDAYLKAGRYNEAAEQYRVLALAPGLSAEEHNSFAVAEADCDLHLKRLTEAQAEALPDTDDENGARRLYLLNELARDRNSVDDVTHIVSEMETRFPHSPWLAQALFSSGNMYLLKRDYANATMYYSYLATHFPADRNAAAAHWRAGWLSYREGQYTEAARLFDEQIRFYPDSTEAVSALYWQGRLDETLGHDQARAVANYRAILRVYPHYFYAQMARDRLAALSMPALGSTQATEEPQLKRSLPLPAPRVVESFPEDSPHLAKARLLVNAGLNEYVADEIKADPDASKWGSLAEAQIYASYGETFRALRAMKRALPDASMAPIPSIPLAYWRILFPEPWWNTIQTESAKNHLDPYLVASLIRQESEFNPSAISYANAYGLMQLLPSVGRAMARAEGNGRFQTFHLLDPETNIRLGTRYLRQMLDQFGGVQAYALAAYNAGDNRVAEWRAAGTYSGIDEFVESIPFTETRGYVEAILRNEETYRAIDELAPAQSREATGTTR
jgi:soluble lytic murein transglycosylase